MTQKVGGVTQMVGGGTQEGQSRFPQRLVVGQVGLWAMGNHSSPPLPLPHRHGDFPTCHHCQSYEGGSVYMCESQNLGLLLIMNYSPNKQQFLFPIKRWAFAHQMGPKSFMYMVILDTMPATSYK